MSPSFHPFLVSQTADIGNRRPLDTLATFETADRNGAAPAPTRYSVRQALDQEYQKYLLAQRANARQAQYPADFLPQLKTKGEADMKDPANAMSKTPKATAVKRDFFGRVITESRPSSKDGATSRGTEFLGERKKEKVWVSFHEGFSNAVRKPISLAELMAGF